MTIGSDRSLTKINRAVSNVFSSSGDLVSLGTFICPEREPLNFVISGGESLDRLEAMYNLLEQSIGRYPIIVLHNGDRNIENVFYSIWDSLYQQYPNEQRVPIWIANTQYRDFEPFDEMTDMQIVSAIRQMAKRLDYTPTPRLERVVRANIEILRLLDVPVSLSGFSYLCQYTDIGELRDNIMALPCGESEANRIWADLGVSMDDSNNQFDLFRTVIMNLSSDAFQSGWSFDNHVGKYNIIRAVREGATFLLNVNDMYAELLLEYLTEELKLSCWRDFLLIIDGISVKDSQIVNFLRQANQKCHLGIVAENAVDILGQDEEPFMGVAEKIDTFVIMKHNTGKVATTFAEMIGKYEHTKVEESRGTGQGFFSLLPRDSHKDRRYSTENRYRVMPEEIIALGPGQAIVFDTANDQVIHYN